jgi:DNA-binding response OmpR family regulator
MSRILMVEDGRDSASALLDHLCNAGHEVEHIGDGAAALDRILSSPPALTLLDVVLPQIDGLQVLQKVRSHSDHPIIMLTARTREVDRLRGLDLGADDYVCKPFSPREVVARVHTVLRRHAQRRRRSRCLSGMRTAARSWRGTRSISRAASSCCCARSRAIRGGCSRAPSCWRRRFRKRST